MLKESYDGDVLRSIFYCMLSSPVSDKSSGTLGVSRVRVGTSINGISMGSSLLGLIKVNSHGTRSDANLFSSWQGLMASQWHVSFARRLSIHR